MCSSSSSVLTVSLCLLMCLPPCLSSDVTVEPGEDATLPCRGSADADVTLLKWSKPDLESELYVFYYRDDLLYPHFLHPSYRGRVELKDPEMKDGDVSVVLKNVTFNDAGRYECVVVNGEGQDRTEQTSSINLRVQVPVNITAEPGQSVSLSCRAPRNTDIVVVEWTRAEPEPEYVLMIRDGRPDPQHQLPSFKDRVELKDGEMKDGDVSMILKEVTRDDAGTYECRVILGKTKSKRGSTEPISIVHLEVHQSGDTENKRLHVGLGVGLPAAALLVVVVAFIVYRTYYRAAHTTGNPAPVQSEDLQSVSCPPSRPINEEEEDQGLTGPGSQTQDQL